MPSSMTLLEMSESWGGYKSLREQKRPANYAQGFEAAIRLIENADRLPQHVWEYRLREAMTTADFPYYFGDSIDRALLDRFKTVRPEMMRICRRRLCKRMMAIKSFRFDGLTNRLQAILEKGEYIAGTVQENKVEYDLYKWGRQVDFSWEAYINDDLGAFSDWPARLADACVGTLDHHITGLFWGAAGPTAGSFGNAAAATTVLTIGNLETAVEAMAAYTDPMWAEPILNRPKFLVIPPALEFTGRQILTSANKMWVYRGTTDAGPTAYPMGNPIGQYGLELIVDPWIPIINTTTPNTTWALFSDPVELAAAEVGFLQGHETPEIFMKSSDQVRVGGGDVSPFEGDFATDNIFYKVRYVGGGAVTNIRACWASTGAG